MAENERVRRELIAAINQSLDRRGWTQVEAAEYLGVSQPRISGVRNGRFRNFRVDSLLTMATKLGITVDVILEPTDEQV